MGMGRRLRDRQPRRPRSSVAAGRPNVDAEAPFHDTGHDTGTWPIGLAATSPWTERDRAALTLERRAIDPAFAWARGVARGAL